MIPILQTVPPHLVTLADHETHALGLLDANARAYFSGGAGDEYTLRANQQAWNQISLRPRVLRSLVGGHTRINLLGRTLAHPILLAPVAFQRLAHNDGELASAYAAAMQGAGFILSTQASVALEVIAQAIRDEPQRGPLWFQLYWQHDKTLTQQLVQRAEQAGYEALVLTVDAASSGVRDRERRAGFTLPDSVFAANLAGFPAPPPVILEPGQSALFDGLLRHAPTWDDIGWLQSITSLPILLKGIMHEEDARLAQQHGVAGIIVSNHGGRTLDTVAATATLLPQIRAAVGSDFIVLVDGGIRRGTDLLKAVALGADAVLLGRPAIYGLRNAGAIGVAHVLRLLRDELEVAMALCGCAVLADVTSAVICAGRTEAPICS
ncbi:alpha-hydroxy acid oxidase [Solimicrobium silvestre]|uniref:L-lactate dehydrogenase (FMN-dependent) and related alpha-hydroxy acid dehydrogenase n=1 Tax=Solimicrobium silvestre TaxID=2099400 RepID=A0A2S9GVY5_9BURK|nr:alpha-hydroxy acid oxidase [Solimicrobium silvestre]PRC91870.1 L-lactate dehydrogenase (FMN-dependent) and related alpha-hydroxy acid dehydrogenase [Solimicrobium silvestre]